MDRGATVQADQEAVARGGVALVLVKPPGRFDTRITRHEAVTLGLGDDRRGHDLGHQGVALDDRLAVHGKRQAKTAVDEHFVRLHAQGPQGPPHGQQRRAMDVDAIDLLGAAPARGPGRGLLSDGGGRRRAFFRGELLGVVQAGCGKPRRQDHCGSRDGPREGAATRPHRFRSVALAPVQHTVAPLPGKARPAQRAQRRIGGRPGRRHPVDGAPLPVVE